MRPSCKLVEGVPGTLRRRYDLDRAVVESDATVRRHRIGPDQGIDSDTAGKGAAGPVALDNDDAGLCRVGGAGAHRHAAAPVGQYHQIAVAKAKTGRVRAVDQRTRLALPGAGA